MKIVLFFKIVLFSIISTAAGLGLFFGLIFVGRLLADFADHNLESSWWLLIIIPLGLFYLVIVWVIPSLIALAPVMSVEFQPADTLVLEMAGRIVRRHVLSYDRTEVAVAVCAGVPLYIVYCLGCAIIVSYFSSGTEATSTVFGANALLGISFFWDKLSNKS